MKKTARQIPAKSIGSKEIQSIIHRMLKIAGVEQKDKNKSVMVGLAAPQIKILKRIILVDVKADGKGKVGKVKVYINPVITWASKQKGEWYEGCYSIPEVCGIVSRPLSIKVQGFTMQPPRLQSKFVTEKYTGYIARIFQHEIDHLDGKLFTSLIKNPHHLHKVLASEFPLYRDKMAWKTWPKKQPLPLALRPQKQI